MAAGLDHQRMKILKRAVDVPVKTSADWPRKKLTREIKDAISQPPLDRLSSRFDDWLSEVDELLRLRDRYAHSRTFYEMRGHRRVVHSSPEIGTDDPVSRRARAG
jgi:hypothetical protein